MQLATSFLQGMNNSLCFFTVALRMLSKVPWTARMATTHIRQDALVAIGKLEKDGGFVLKGSLGTPLLGRNWRSPLLLIKVSFNHKCRKI